MAKFQARHCTVLDGAIRAARKAMTAMTSKEIPAGVIRAAGMTGRTLPPPLAISVLEELDRSEWLRAKALEHLPEDIHGPSREFLEQSERWWMAVEEASIAQAVSTTERLVSEMTASEESMKKALAIAKQRATAARAASEKALREVDERIASDKASLQEVIDRLTSDIAASTHALEAAQAAASDAGRRAEAAEGDLARVNARLRRTRRDASSRRKRRVQGSAPTDPVALAVLLDSIARDVSISGPGGGRLTESEVSPAFALPAGVAPDSKPAIEAIADFPGSVRVIVDGFNVAHLLANGEAPSATVRMRLEAGLARLRLAAKGAMSVVVIYDSAVVGEREPPRVTQGVEVRFAPHDVIADEEIIAEADMASGTVVVISNDREVREAAEDCGAVSLWSDALVAWLS